MRNFKNYYTGIIFFIAAACLMATDAVAWDSFRMNLDSVSISIAQQGNTLSAAANLSAIAGQGERIPGNEQGSIKREAIAMAMGYAVFLKLTQLPENLKKAGASEELVDKIMSGAGLNYTLAMGFQETGYDRAGHSGYFQIDNAPWELLFNALNSNYGGTRSPDYYHFLYYLNGGASYGPDESRTAQLCKPGQKGFVWDAVEKAYYDALSYNMNKVPYNDMPSKGFGMAQWAVAYAKNFKPTRAPFLDGDIKTRTLEKEEVLEAPGASLSIPPESVMGISLSYLYNRGQNPYSNHDLEQSKMYNDVLINGTPFEDVFNEYPDLTDMRDAVAWGKRYIWQIPWLFTLLNDGAETYQEKIEKKDVMDVLTILKGFYNGEKPDGDLAVQAGMEKADSLKWGFAFDSGQTFENIVSVVQAVMTKSQDIQFTQDMHDIVTKKRKPGVEETWYWEGRRLDVTNEPRTLIDWEKDSFYQ